MRTVIFPIGGMNFATSGRSIEKRLGALAAISQVVASYVSQTVTITYDETSISERVLHDLIKDYGFACGEPITAADQLQAGAWASQCEMQHDDGSSECRTLT